MRLRKDIAGIATPSLLGLALLLQFAHVGHDHDSDESEPHSETEPPCICVHLDRIEADVGSLQDSGTAFVSRIVVGTGVNMRAVPGRRHGPGARAPPAT